MPHLSYDQIVQKMHDFYYNLGYLPGSKELRVLKSEIGISNFPIKKEFKKQFERFFKNDNPAKLRARCNKCEAIKKLSDFRSVKKTIYGIGECKDCTNQYHKKLNESNPRIRTSYPWKEYCARYYKKHSVTVEYKIKALNKQLLLAKKQYTIEKILIKLAELKEAKAFLIENQKD